VLLYFPKVTDLLLLQDVITRCLAIYEVPAALRNEQPVHLARWLLPAKDAVVLLQNEGFSSLGAEGEEAT
jgi:hypothetical protein